MSKMGTPVVIVIGVVAVTVVIVIGLVANAALSDDDDESLVVEGAETSQPLDAGDAGSGETVTTTVEAGDRPLEKAELERVQRAALQVAGGGTVTDVDRSDDLGEAYEVEVQTDAGEVDVALDNRLERVPNLRFDD